MIQFLKKSRIISLFKVVVIALFIINFCSIYKFIVSYSFNRVRFNHYGTITFIKRSSNRTMLYIKSNYNIVAILDENEKLKIGDVISFKYSIKDINKNTIFNTFNYQMYLKSLNIYGYVNITSYKVLKYDNYYKLRNYFEKRISSKKSRGYIKTFLMSDKSLIDLDVKDAYAKNGISHMLCVSGFHVVFLLEFLKKILKKVKISGGFSSLFLLIFSILYLYISSFPISLVRAIILYFFNYFNEHLNLKINKFLIFVMTLNLSLFMRPYIIYNTSFWYSYILCFFLMFYKAKKVNWFIDSVKVSCYAFLISLPLTIYLSNYVNLLTIVLNVFLLIIACYIIYPLCFFAIFLSISDILLLKIIKLFEFINLKIANINYFTIVFPKFNIFVLLVLYLFLLFLVYKRSIKFLLLYLFLLVFVKVSVFFDSNNYLYFLDVNQGDMQVLISSNRKAVTVIDTGGLIDKKYLEKNVKSFLYSLGIIRINNLIITHGDYDHMGEAINLVNNFKVENVIFNCGPYNDLESELIKALDKKKIRYYSCIKELNIDNNKLYFLQTKEYDNENDNSNVIYTELDGYKFMFMGDASSTTEKEILEKYNLPDMDVLKVGHHGSKTSSSKEFIDDINPKYSVISVGNNNRYGHPNKEVLDNLKNSKIYRTDQDGSIMLKIKNNKLKIETCSP